MRIIVTAEPPKNSQASNQNSSDKNGKEEEKSHVPSKHAHADSITNSNTKTLDEEPTKKRTRTSKKLRSDNKMDSEDGYNSADEYAPSVPPAVSGLTLEEWKEKVKQYVIKREEQFRKFEEALKRSKGYEIKRMGDDGNCLFRAMADQIFGDQDMHDQIRERCMNYMQAERDHYSQFVTEDFDSYLARKRQDKEYGNNLEIQAIGELYNRPIEIYTFQQDALKLEPINIFHNQYETDNPPIRVSYHNGNHYNSVIDPKNPSIGVGLGLPNLEPGLADKNLMKEAIKKSENEQLEEILLQQFQKETELESAETEIEDQILQQSRKEYEEKMMQDILNESRKSFIENMFSPKGKSEL